MTIRFTRKSGQEFNSYDRERLASAVSRCVDCRQPGFEPYKPNAHNDTYWTVDSGNDWKVRFPQDATASFELVHRYSRSPEVQVSMQAVAPWLSHIFNCTSENLP